MTTITGEGATAREATTALQAALGEFLRENGAGMEGPTLTVRGLERPALLDGRFVTSARALVADEGPGYAAVEEQPA